VPLDERTALLMMSVIQSNPGRLDAIAAVWALAAVLGDQLPTAERAAVGLHLLQAARRFAPHTPVRCLPRWLH